jgi:hypothetical protein
VLLVLSIAKGDVRYVLYQAREIRFLFVMYVARIGCFFVASERGLLIGRIMIRRPTRLNVAMPMAQL